MSTEASSAPHDIGELTTQNWPTITADRAIRVLTPEIAVDPLAITTYYDSVPKDGKPPLSDLQVHASASIVVEKGATSETDRSRFGVFLRPGQKLPHYLPELKGSKGRVINPTIVIFIGSAVVGCESVRTPEMATRIVNGAITHELVHYAQSGMDPRYIYARKPVTQQIRDETSLAFLKAQRGMYDILFDGSSLKAAAAACITSVAFWDAEKSLLMTVGTGAIVHGLGHGARKRARHDRRFENVYQNDPDETEAFELEDEEMGIITLGEINPDLNEDDLWVIRHRIHSSLPRKYVKQFMHRQTSLRPQT